MRTKFYLILAAVLIFTVAVIGLLSNPKSEEPDLSLLNIDNFLSAMATGGDIAVETEDGLVLTVSPNSNLLKVFKQDKWKEKKANSPVESSATLKIVLHDGYYINFYSYEDYAMIYNKDTKEKYRYYTIPAGVYFDLQSYILENGKTAKAGYSDIWIQKPSRGPIEVVQSAIENQADKDYTIAVSFGEAEVDDTETQRQVDRYKGSELAEKRGWTETYLKEHFLIVKAYYYVEYDHTKTFMNDGDLEQYFYLTRDIDTGLWSIIDNSSSSPR